MVRSAGTGLLAGGARRQGGAEGAELLDGRIPGPLQSVDRLENTRGGEMHYRYFEGPAFQRQDLPGDLITQRLEYLSGKKASVLPYP